MDKNLNRHLIKEDIGYGEETHEKNSASWVIRKNIWKPQWDTPTHQLLSIGSQIKKQSYGAPTSYTPPAKSKRARTQISSCLTSQKWLLLLRTSPSTHWRGQSCSTIFSNFTVSLFGISNCGFYIFYIYIK